VANSLQARKRARQAVNRRALRIGQRSAIRTAIKKVLAAIAGGDQNVAKEEYASAVPIIDRLADKGVIHKNKAARLKSRLCGHVKAMS